MKRGRWVLLAVAWLAFLTAVAVALSGGQQGCTLPTDRAPIAPPLECPPLGHPYAVATAITCFVITVLLAVKLFRTHRKGTGRGDQG